MRLLHLADVHLDAPFGGRSTAVRRALQDSARESVTRAVALALDEGVHGVVIAGDLFDGSRLSFATERFLTAAFRELGDAGIPVIYASGNHDPGDGRHPAGALDWPSNVVVVDGPQVVRMPVRDAQGSTVGWVSAAGHASSRVTDDLAATFPRPPRDRPEVALLHALVRGSRAEDDHHAYAPTTMDTLLGAGYDYWALGHVHRRQLLARLPLVCYPGSLQGRNLRETGPRGGLVVDLDDPTAPVATFRELSPVRWEVIPLSGLEAMESVELLLGALKDAWEDARRGDAGGPDTRWMIQFRLSGGSPLWKRLRQPEELATLEQEATTLLGALDVSVLAHRLGPPVDPARERERIDVLGEALRLLERVHEGEVELDVKAPDLAGYDPQRHGDVNSYVRGLLRDMDREVVARLRSPDGDGG